MAGAGQSVVAERDAGHAGGALPLHDHVGVRYLQSGAVRLQHPAGRLFAGTSQSVLLLPRPRVAGGGEGYRPQTERAVSASCVRFFVHFALAGRRHSRSARQSAAGRAVEAVCRGAHAADAGLGGGEYSGRLRQGAPRGRLCADKPRLHDRMRRASGRGFRRRGVGCGRRFRPRVAGHMRCRAEVVVRPVPQCISGEEPADGPGAAPVFDAGVCFEYVRIRDRFSEPVLRKPLFGRRGFRPVRQRIPRTSAGRNDYRCRGRRAAAGIFEDVGGGGRRRAVCPVVAGGCPQVLGDHLSAVRILLRFRS